jgi:hypothetical protein
MALATFDRLHDVFVATIEDPAIRGQTQGPNWHTLRNELAQKLTHLAQGDATAVVWLLLQQVRSSVAADFVELLVQVLDAADGAGDLVRQVVVDKALPEAVQREAVCYLGRRHDPGCLPTLLSVLVDEFRPARVRRCALDAIVDGAMVDSLPVLRTLSAATQQRGEVGLERILAARLRLGDFSALRPLLDLYPQTASAQHAPSPGDVIELVGLVDSVGGLHAMLDLIAAPAAASPIARLQIVAELEPSPGVRQWALGELTRRDPEGATKVLLAALGDRNRAVASTAGQCLCALAAPPRAELAMLAADEAASVQQRLWAIYTLVLLGEDVTALLAALPDARAMLPPQVSPELRVALAALSLRHANAHTDLRWLIDAHRSAQPHWGSGEERVLELVNGLRRAGLSPRLNEGFPQPVSPADYWKVALRNEDYLYVSRRGPFVAFAVENIVTFELGSWSSRTQVEELSDIDPLGERALKRRRCQEAAAANGFFWLDKELLELQVPGLDGSRTDPERTSLWSIVFGNDA